LNSLILLRSAVTLTWSHYNFLLRKETKVSFLITLFLGLVFLIVQLSEYRISGFSIRDSVYGSIFFMITGFHGAHVFLGLLFLNLNYLRLKKGYFRVNHHLSFEFSIIYWHFVDVIWLFLYVFLYWWSL
jgi:heme/copper-type cytochrome/quinol oxidase subunit 3